MDHYLERVIDLLDPALNRICNMTIAEARSRVAEAIGVPQSALGDLPDDDLRDLTGFTSAEICRGLSLRRSTANACARPFSTSHLLPTMRRS